MPPGCCCACETPGVLPPPRAHQHTPPVLPSIMPVQRHALTPYRPTNAAARQARLIGQVQEASCYGYRCPLPAPMKNGGLQAAIWTSCADTAMGVMVTVRMGAHASCLTTTSVFAAPLLTLHEPESVHVTVRAKPPDILVPHAEACHTT